jgi:TRAP-type C4-dicarboxylate transport system permease large subunit
MGLGPVELVLMICVLYLVLGTFMEELSMVVTTIPIFLPLLKMLGVDLVWFGVIVIMLIQASIVSPPVGMNLFVIQSLRKHLAARGENPPIKDVFIGVLPFFGAIVVTLILVIAFPQIALWLPNSAK